MSSKDGAFFVSGLLACSSMNTLLVAAKPYSDRKVAIEAIRGEGIDAAGLVLGLVFFASRDEAVALFTSVGDFLDFFTAMIIGDSLRPYLI